MSRGHLVFRSRVLLVDTDQQPTWNAPLQPGDWVYDKVEGGWNYFICRGNMINVNKCDVPKEIKMYLLLMGVT